MINDVRILTRIALFSALIYVFSWATSYIPNVNLIFFVVFSAGYLWGSAAGFLVGTIGMLLWTVLNPFGPAALPVMLAQIFGAGLSGFVGSITAGLGFENYQSRFKPIWLALCAVICTVCYYLPVNLVDAYLFQPFMPRFISGWIMSLLSLGSNVLIFPLLFPVVSRLYKKERLLL